jgi:hypothetical protein
MRDMAVIALMPRCGFELCAALPFRTNAPSQDAFAGDHTFELRGLGHHGGVRFEAFAEFDHATERKLLIHHGSEPNLAWRRFSAGMNVRHRMHHRGQTGLVIDGAAPVEFPVTNHRIERGNRHAFDRNRVRMRLEDDPAR